jgi:hypothetical protein
MANLRYATARRNAMMDDVRAALAGGSIKVYSGTQPANANTALSGNTLLATLTLASPAGAASSGDVYLRHHHELALRLLPARRVLRASFRAMERRWSAIATWARPARPSSSIL